VSALFTIAGKNSLNLEFTTDLCSALFKKTTAYTLSRIHIDS
jgi:hypothetical protein